MSDVSSPAVYSQNVLNDIIYPPNYDPTTTFPPNAVISPSNQFANTDSLNWLLGKLPKRNGKTDWVGIVVFTGVFILTMLYFGTYIVKNT